MEKRGQIWVETVIYTLIAFAMIGLVLAYAKPKIEELQDKTIIEQTISVMKDFDKIILNMGGAGNQRIIKDLKIKKGELIIDGDNDRIYFEIESKHVYSEPGTPIYDANLIIYTKSKGGKNLVNITRDYSGKYNITYNNEDKLKTLSASSASYKLTILNKGDQGGDLDIINLEVS